jgi:hypothetical protein
VVIEMGGETGRSGMDSALHVENRPSEIAVASRSSHGFR